MCKVVAPEKKKDIGILDIFACRMYFVRSRFK